MLKFFKKLWGFLRSMKFAILLLVLLAAACAGGSFVPQKQEMAWYFEHYSPRIASLILGTGFDDVFHSWWFLTVTGFLCLNLLLCNLLRLPQLIRRTRAAGDWNTALAGSVTASVARIAEPERLFAKLRLPKPQTVAAEGKTLLFSCKNRIGLWGAWVCHLGILLLIAGFTLGQITMEQYALAGASGQTKLLGSTNLAVEIRDFRVDLQKDDTVKQYTSQIRVHDLTDTENDVWRDATVSVNHPVTCYGYQFSQNAMGRGAALRVYRNGTLLEEQGCRPGDEPLRVLDTDLTVQLLGIRDYENEDGSTVTGYEYQIFAGEEFYKRYIQWEGEAILDFFPYEVLFEPGYYTVLQVKRDSFKPLALAGGLIALLGLFLAFYLQPKQVWAEPEEDGTWVVKGRCPKAGALFAAQLRQASAPFIRQEKH